MSAITTANPDLETAIQFLNFAYTDAGSQLMQYGIADTSFSLRDDEPIFTDLVLHNPDKLPFPNALALYAYPPHNSRYQLDNIFFAQNGPAIQSGAFFFNWYSEKQIEALKIWGNSDVKNHFIPPLTIPVEKSEAYKSIRKEINEYVDESFLLFIIGEKPLAEFDEYLTTLNKMNVQQMVEIYQEIFTAYNR